MKHGLAGILVMLGVLLVAGGCSTATGAESVDTTTSTSTTVTETTSTSVPPTTLAETTTTTTVPDTTTTTEDPTKPTVEVNGARLAYNCWGTGSPTVVVELGLNAGVGRSATWFGWDKALEGIAETNKVCIYGRRGVGGSEAPDSTVTTQDQVDDLQGLITALDVDTPLILVGHSVAGYNLRVFADEHPDEVAGLVFVDATDPGIVEHFPLAGAAIPERLDTDASAEQVNPITDLGDLPVHVLTATEQPDWWLDLQQILVGLSTNSLQVEVDSGHFIHAVKPETVVDGVAWVVSQTG